MVLSGYYTTPLLYGCAADLSLRGGGKGDERLTEVAGAVSVRARLNHSPARQAQQLVM